jgi:hypothetical protein
MAVDIPMARKGNHAVPVDQIASDEFVNAVSEGAEFMATIRRPRSLKQHRYAWALANIIADAHPDMVDREQAMALLKLKSRFVSYAVDPKTGELFLYPKSIAFDRCPQEMFSRLLNRFIYITVTEIIPGLSDSELRTRLEEMVGNTANHEQKERA